MLTFAAVAQKGTAGRRVTAITNYYTLKMDSCTQIHQYELMIDERRSDATRELFKARPLSL